MQEYMYWSSSAVTKATLQSHTVLLHVPQFITALPQGGVTMYVTELYYTAFMLKKINA